MTVQAVIGLLPQLPIDGHGRPGLLYLSSPFLKSVSATAPWQPSSRASSSRANATWRVPSLRAREAHSAASRTIRGGISQSSAAAWCRSTRESHSDRRACHSVRFAGWKRQAGFHIRLTSAPTAGSDSKTRLSLGRTRLMSSIRTVVEAKGVGPASDLVPPNGAPNGCSLSQEMKTQIRTRWKVNQNRR
jgi:hypothetical protein